MPLKTTEQLRAIFGLGRKLGFEKTDLEELAAVMTNGGIERLSLLSFDQANEMIRHLGGDPFAAATRSPVPRRTANYRKQRAGIKTIETASHQRLIKTLALGRGMTEKGLARLADRMHLAWPPLTTEQGNKLVEALKAMNARDARRAA